MSNAEHDRSNDDTSTNAGSSRIAAKRVTAGIAVVVALLILAVVFMKSDNKSAKSDTSTSTVATPTTLSAGEQKVLADYRAFWDAFLAAGNPVAPDSPALAAHATGEEYQKLVNSFSATKSSNAVVKGTVDLQPIIGNLMGSSATVSDCIDDRTGVYDAVTGERRDEDDPRRRKSTAEMTLIDGTWKVSKLTSGGLGCTGP